MMSSMQGGGNRVMQFGKSTRQAGLEGDPEGHVLGCRGGRRGRRRAPRDQGLPEGPGALPGRRRPHPEGRAAVRPSRNGKDAARPCRRRRGRRAVLLDQRFRLRRDVRRRRRQPRARPVRAGQAERAGHHLRRRDRRRRPPPRGRPRRRSRRARADPQPAAGRDGRIRRQDQRHPDRRDQPPRHPGPCTAASRTLRPPDRRGRARPEGPREDPVGARQGQADGQGRRPRGAGAQDARLHRCRPGQRAQRGGAAHGAQQRSADRQPRPG